MVLILIISLILRLINLNQSLWLDEAITALTVKNYNILEIITKFSPGDFHPPLYYLVLKIWATFFGYSEIALRIPSVIFGVLTVYFVYKIGGKKFGLLAGLFTALNPLAIYYSQEARMYSLAAFSVTAAVWFFLQKKWFWWGLFFLIGLYSDYVVWFMLPVFILFKKRSAIICLLLLPLLILLKDQLLTGMQIAGANPLWSQVVGGLDPKAAPLTLVKFIFGRITIENKIIYAVIFGGISLAYLWIISHAKDKFTWLWFVLPVALGFIISFKIPIFSYFRFLFVLPAFSMLLAEGTIKNKINAILICLISLISLIWFNVNPSFQREDWRGAAAYITASGTKVFMPSVAQDAGLKYYAPSVAVNDRNNIMIGQERTVFLIRYVQEIFDPEDFIRRVLELSGYQKIDEKNFNGVVVWKYQL